MRKISLFLKVINSLINFVGTEEFKNNSRVSACDFTRNRKLSFEQYIFILLIAVGSSIHTTLDTALDAFGMRLDSYSKQAFSKGRQRIKPEAIQKIIEFSADEFYHNAAIETYKGYRILAIDGSKLNLPESHANAHCFGRNGDENAQIECLLSTMHDALNGIILDARIARVHGSERVLAEEHFEYLASHRLSGVKDLIIMDRGYPSAELIKKLDSLGIAYLMRCQGNFIRKWPAEADSVITHTFTCGITAKIRCINLQHDGKTDHFITNVPARTISTNEIAELYAKRWAIEELYKFLKIKELIERFSGSTPLAIQQDIYAAVVIANLCACLMHDANPMIQKQYRGRHVAKVNKSCTWKEIKTNLMTIVFSVSRRKRSDIIEEMIQTVVNNRIVVVPNRRSARQLKHRCFLKSIYVIST